MPLVASWQRMTKAGSVCSAPVISGEFFPTPLDSTRVQSPAGGVLDGASLMTLLTGSAGLAAHAEPGTVGRTR